MTIEKVFSIGFYVVITMLTLFLAGHILPGNGEEKILQWPMKRAMIKPRYRSVYEKLYLFSIIGVLFLCSALRFGIGNDYGQYVQTAHEASVNGYVVTEPGFNWLVKMIYAIFGFECYEAVFAVFAFVTLVIMIKALYEQSVDFTMSFFLFMTLGIYFQTFNTVRYYLALAIVLYAMRYVFEKDWIRFVLWIIAASLFHKSVLLVIPVYWLAAKRWKRWHMTGMAILSALAFLLRKYVLQAALILYPSYRDTVFLKGGTSLISIIRTAVILSACFWYWKRYGDQCEKPQEFWFYTQLNYAGLLVYVFFSFLPVVTRIAYYFTICQLFLIPVMIYGIAKEKNRQFMYGFMILACAGYFCIFLLQADKPGVGLLPYQSWLFQTERLLYK